MCAVERRRLPIALSALLSVACVEVAQIELGPDTPAGLLVLQSGDRRQVIAFEDRVRVEAGQAEAGLLLALVCPLETYGLTPGTFDAFGQEVSPDRPHRSIPLALKTRPLEEVGLTPLDLLEVGKWKVLTAGPWAELPRLRNQRSSMDTLYWVNSFGRWLFDGRLLRPFSSVEGPPGPVRGFGDGGHRPDGTPELLTIVEVASDALELRANTFGPEGWRSETLRAWRGDGSCGHGELAGVWSGSQRLVLADLRCTSWRADGNAPMIETEGLGAARWADAFAEESKIVLNLAYGGVLEIDATGRVTHSTLRHKSPSWGGGWWLVDEYEQLQRTGPMVSTVLDSPSRLTSQRSSGRGGALATWTGDEVLFWPAEPCRPAWRWSIGRTPDAEEQLFLTDAYLVVREHTSRQTEWRLRPDVEPPEEPEE